MRAIHPVDFNKEWAKTVTREKFIAHFTSEGEPVHNGIDYGAEYDKIVPSTKAEDKKAAKA